MTTCSSRSNGGFVRKINRAWYSWSSLSVVWVSFNGEIFLPYYLFDQNNKARGYKRILPFPRTNVSI